MSPAYSLLPGREAWQPLYLALPIDPAEAMVAAEGELRRLSPQEQAVLAVLLTRVSGTTDDFMTALWGRWLEPPETASSALRMVVSGLRRKLRGAGVEIVTLTGRGYAMVPAAANDRGSGPKGGAPAARPVSMRDTVHRR